MKLLYIGDKFFGDDIPEHTQRLMSLSSLSGHHVSASFLKRETATEVALLCKSKGFDAVVCSQLSLLQAALRNTVDFIASKKAITIDDYAGSWITLPHGIPMLVIGHLERLFSVPYERYITNRYLSKLTKPDSWFPQTEFKWEQVRDDNYDSALAAILAADLCAIDIETVNDDAKRIECVAYSTYSFSTGQQRTYVVYFNSEFAYEFVRRANASPCGKIFQNGLYDNAYFLRWNCPVHNWLWDTLILLHCWYSELPKRLDFVAAFALRKQRFWKNDGRTGNLEDLFRYNALDAWATLNSFLSLIAEMPEWAVNNYLIEFPLVFPALHANMEGIKVDKERYKEVIKKKEKEAEALLAEVRELISEPEFNPRSPVQMKNLFKMLGVGYLPDTAKASMLKARYAHPLNEYILSKVVKYKESAKLISSYLDEELLWLGRWFYGLDPAGTDTGRAACKGSPFWCGNSIQTIPRGDILKQCFIADDGWQLAEPDKAQSEARCVGYMSGETKLIELVESAHDYHAWNAAAFFGTPYTEIYSEETKTVLDKELRDLSKRTNHGANYNMTAPVMLDTMGPANVAKAKMKLKLPRQYSLLKTCGYLLEQYEATYPRVKGLFYESIISQIAQTSKLVSPLGWTRYFFSKPSKANKPALNAAVAHGPQNLSVGIINREWYKVWRETVYGSLRGLVRIKAQIHDSLLFQYKGEDTPAKVQALMHTPVQVTGADGIPRTMLIRTDMKAGAVRWSEIS